MDLGALQAMEAAQDAFDERLTESFTAAFAEVEGLGYPGVSDPRPRVSTRLRAIDGLNHSAAISFEIDVIGGDGSARPRLRLPEGNNGLGYQNLISMIFRLMSFCDAWMRVGKASKAVDASRIEPLHLVLVGEPEAHLHAQVQQVFINKAYAVLRAHGDLAANEKLRTQLVVSTHLSHVAHETPFSCLRYFRRLPAGMAAKVPVSTVVNLAEVFGPGNETERFVTRYLRAQHSDLFFADAIILVEGPAERMLLPNFIREHYGELNRCYITLLEIGGRHVPQSIGNVLHAPGKRAPAADAVGWRHQHVHYRNDPSPVVRRADQHASGLVRQRAEAPLGQFGSKRVVKQDHPPQDLFMGAVGRPSPGDCVCAPGLHGPNLHGALVRSQRLADAGRR